MLIASECNLVAVLAEAQLLDSDQLEELSHSLCVRFPDPRELAGHLAGNGWLTAYQARQLLLGKVKQLRLGPYRLLEKLGEGGMGEVFKARHDNLGRIVALKIIRHLTNERLLERFRREAEAAARLTHPNIVTLFDAGEIGDTHFLAMEFIDGIDLGRLVEETGRLPAPQACEYIRQAALGLQHAHERGLVHRDVKPANLLVKPPDSNGRKGAAAQNLLAAREAAALFEGGIVKLLDLGMACIQYPLPNGKEARLTSEGVLVGTLDYVAPEQGRDSHRVDHRADLYSLGCTLFHLLSGAPPFAEFDGIEKLLQHISAPPPSLRAACADIPETLAALVARLMAKRPDERYQTAAEVANALIPLAEARFTCQTVEPLHSPPAAVTPIPQTLEMPIANPKKVSGTPARRAEGVSPPWYRSHGGLTPSARRILCWRFAVMAALVVAALTIFAALLKYGVPRAAEEKQDAKLPAYMPADTAAFVSINAQELWSAPIVKKLDAAGAIGHLADNRVGPNLFSALRLHPENDVDQLRVMYGASTIDRPLYWAHGKFDAEPASLARPPVQALESDRFPGFSFCRTDDALGSPTTRATDGHTMLSCQDPARICSALREALAGCQPELRADGFRDLFPKVDQQQTIWLIAAMTPFRGLKPSINVETEQLLKPFFMHAESVYGTIQLKEDAQAVIHVRTVDDNNAELFAEEVNELKRKAKTRAEQATTPNALRPLMRCLADSKLNRKKKDFTLEFCLKADMVK